jgi:hypothetical protein
VPRDLRRAGPALRAARPPRQRPPRHVHTEPNSSALGHNKYKTSIDKVKM